MNFPKRLVPWQKWEEWSYVKDLLYSMDYNQQLDGISIVKAWKCRCTAIPISIECTSIFTELLMKIRAIIHNRTIESNQMDYSELMYSASMALIRMVNGIVDAEQKGVYSKSVNVIAEEVGLPREFVDLRHRCTHGTIPSIEVLYSSMEEAKKWLYEYYWLVFYFDLNHSLETGGIHYRSCQLDYSAASDCQSNRQFQLRSFDIPSQRRSPPNFEDSL